MSEKNDNQEPDELSLENEILKMKLKLKFGDDIVLSEFKEIPLEVENQFLKNIMAFEEANKNKKTISIFNKLGKPSYIKADNLNPETLSKELNRILSLLKINNIDFHINQGPYPDETIYRFITEELFQEEIDEIAIDGMMLNFIYEEFHPNHVADLQEANKTFIKHWFDRNFNDYQPLIANELISIENSAMNINEFRVKINSFFKCFNDGKFKLLEQKHQFGADNFGMGHTEGVIFYKAKLEIGETIEFYGPYIIYFQNRWGQWEVCSFRIPGFELK